MAGSISLNSTAHLAAEGSRCLLTAALPCAVRSVHVVEASNAALNAKVVVVVLVQLFGAQLLQAIRVLWLQVHDRVKGSRSCHIVPYKYTRQKPCNKQVTCRATQPKTEVNPSSHLCWPRPLLPQATALHLWVKLLVFGVHARGGGIEDPATKCDTAGVSPGRPWLDKSTQNTQNLSPRNCPLLLRISSFF